MARVIVIPKEGWARMAAPILLLARGQKVGVIPKEGWTHVPSFGMTMTQAIRDPFSRDTAQIKEKSGL